MATVEDCSSAPKTVEVRSAFMPAITVSSTGPYCPGEDDVQLRVSGVLLSAPIRWFKNGVLDPSQTGPFYVDNLVVADGGTTVNYSVQVTDPADGSEVTLMQDVDILPAIEARIDGPPGICENAPATFNVVRADGTPFPPGFSYFWTINGNARGDNTQASYTVDDNPFNSGNPEELSVRITSPDGCRQTFTESYVVPRSVQVRIINTTSTICPGDSIELCATAEFGVPPYNYQWNSNRPGDNMRCQIIDADYKSIVPDAITVMVTDASGCTDVSNEAFVDTQRPLTGLIIEECMSSGTSIPFSWNNVGQDFFEIYLTFEGTAEAIIDPGYTQTTYTVDDVSPGEEVRIRVVPVRRSTSGDCPGQDDFQICSVGACESPGWAIDYDDQVCVGDEGQDIEVRLTARLIGEVTLTSDDLGLTDFPVQSNGAVTILSLPPLPPDGGRIGTYTVRASHNPGIDECVSDTVFTIQVSTPAEDDFFVSSTLICEGSLDTFSYEGDTTGLTFDWRFGGADVRSGDVNGPGPIVAQFPNIGEQLVQLRIRDPFCGLEQLRRTVNVINLPIPPEITCRSSTPSSVTYDWEEQFDIDSYEVIVNGGEPIRVDGNSYTVDGLTSDAEVNFSARAISRASCGNGAFSDPVLCSPQNCPTFRIDLNGLQDTICIIDGTETIDLSAIAVTGGSGAGAVMEFEGDNITGSTFEAAAAGGAVTGLPYFITVNYTEGGCPGSWTVAVFVFTPPTASIEADAAEACLGQPFTFTVEAEDVNRNSDRTVDFGGGTQMPDADPNDNSYTVVWDTPGAKTVTATVSNAATGCTSDETSTTFTVISPLEAPVITCASNELTETTFSWGVVAGAEGYEVSASSGQSATLDGATTTFTVTGLDPGQSTTLTVTPIGSGPCGNGPSSTESCSAETCPGSMIEIQAVTLTQCLDGTESDVPLTAELEGGPAPAGTLTWSGRGVVDNGDGTASFSPAGLDAGEYDVTVQYAGPNDCNSEDRVILTLLDAPSAGITGLSDVACIGVPIVVGLSEPVTDGVTYDWGGFDGASGIIASGDEQYELSWDTEGVRNITLTATAGECTTTGNYEVTVLSDLPSPEPTCSEQTFNGVTFSWPEVVGATDGYLVSIDGGAPTAQSATSLRLSPLALGQEVTIQVAALRSGTGCDTSAMSDIVACAATNCPFDLAVAPAAAQTEFCGDGGGPVSPRS